MTNAPSTPPAPLPNDPHGQWERTLWLDRAVREHRYPSLAALMEQFECSRRTACNTVAFLRDTLGAPLHYHRKHGGYAYTDPTYALPSVFLQEGELLALFLAEQVSRQYLGSPLEAPLREAVGKLCRYLPEAVQVDLESLSETIRFTGGSSVEVPVSLLQELRRAIRERRRVRMRYYTAHRDEWNERDVEPHFLENVRGDWMLVAWDLLRGEEREFMLSRISDYRLLPGRFTPRPELHPEQYRRHVFVTERGGEPFAVALRFDAYQARWIRERSWHPSQELKETGDGGVVLRLRVAGVGDLCRWILGYGRHVQVLEPEWLREQVAEELRQAAAGYGTSEPPMHGANNV